MNPDFCRKVYVLLGINDADNRAVSGRVFAFEGKTGFLAATPEHKLTDACSDCIDRYHRFPARLEIPVDRLHHEQLPALE
jgi:hypothetical protein